MWVQKVPGGGVAHLAFSPGGETLYTLDTGGWLTAWDLASRGSRRLSRIESQDGWFSSRIYALADGETVVTRMDVVGYWEATLNQDGTIAEPPVVFTLWDVTTGQVLTRLNPPGLHQGSHAQVLPDGRLYYLGPGSKEIMGWNLRTESPEPSLGIREMTSDIFSFKLSTGGQFVCTLFQGNGPPVLHQVVTGTELRNPLPINGIANAYKISFSPDDRTVALFSTPPPRISLWDIRNRTIRAAGIPSDLPVQFAWNPTTPMFAALNPNHMLTLFSSDTGEPLRSLDFALGRSVRCVAFSPDGLTCAVGGSNKQFAVFDVDL